MLRIIFRQVRETLDIACKLTELIFVFPKIHRSIHSTKICLYLFCSPKIIGVKVFKYLIVHLTYYLKKSKELKF